MFEIYGSDNTKLIDDFKKESQKFLYEYYLKIINSYPNGIYSTEIKKIIVDELKKRGIDVKNTKIFGRSLTRPGETKIEQIIRNITSNRPKELWDRVRAEIDENGKIIFYPLDISTESKLNEIIENELEDSIQNESINSDLIKGYSDEEILNKKNSEYIFVKEDKKIKNSRIKTDPRLKYTRLEKANFKCEIDNNHLTFPSKSGNHQYVECHHIIPINAQSEFIDKNLDSLFNLISLCPICHSSVHYSNYETRQNIFNKMYSIRKKEFNEQGIFELKIQEIFNKYYK